MSYKPQADVHLDGSIVLADIAAAQIDPVAGTAGLRTLGTGAQQAAVGSSTVNLTGAQSVGGVKTFTNIPIFPSDTVTLANLIATGTRNTTTFYRGDGTFAVPTASVVYTIQSKTTAYTSVATDDVILCDAAGGSFSITTHSAATATKPLTIKRTNSGANTVTIDANASETIDGAATYVISQVNESVTIVSNGTNWFII